MPIRTKRTDASRIEDIRALLKKAAYETRKLSIEARDKASWPRLKVAKAKEHGRRYRIAKGLADSMDALTDLLWELPGVKWP